MSGSTPAILGLMGAKMAYQSQRQALLSQNISNLDHPDYQAKDLKPFDFERLVGVQLKRLQVRATSPKHLPAKEVNTSSFKNNKLGRKAFEQTPVGNNVSLDQQTALAAQNAAEFQLTSSLFRKYGQLLRTAAVGVR
jgi:flagellar basal-body rod protein FlgB